jgi:para-nitrobenzyl esterase
VFGESGGAGSIMHLLTTPGIGGLVRGAIAESPGLDFTQRADVAATVAQSVLRKAGVGNVDQLRAMSAEELLQVQLSVSQRLLFEIGTMVFHPVVDGEFVTESPSIALAEGAATDVALLIGCTADEMRLFPDPRADALDREGLARWAHGYLASRTGREPGEGTAERLVDAYLDAAKGATRRKGSDVWASISADGIMREPVLRLAASRPPSARTFVYQFDWQARHPERDLGAFHAIDLPFVFDAFDVDGWGEFIGADDDARALGRAIRSAWAAFARDGDPSCAAIGTWPPYDAVRRETMVLDAHWRVEADPARDERLRWAGLWDPACRPAPVSL